MVTFFYEEDFWEYFESLFDREKEEKKIYIADNIHRWKSSSSVFQSFIFNETSRLLLLLFNNRFYCERKTHSSLDYSFNINWNLFRHGKLIVVHEGVSHLH